MESSHWYGCEGKNNSSHGWWQSPPCYTASEGAVPACVQPLSSEFPSHAHCPLPARRPDPMASKGHNSTQRQELLTRSQRQNRAHWSVPSTPSKGWPGGGACERLCWDFTRPRKKTNTGTKAPTSHVIKKALKENGICFFSQNWLFSGKHLAAVQQGLLTHKVSLSSLSDLKRKHGVWLQKTHWFSDTTHNHRPVKA